MPQHSTGGGSKAARGSFSIKDGSRRNFFIVPNRYARAAHDPRFLVVLMNIASRAGDGGVCTASSDTIHEETGVKRDTIFKAIAYWQDAGVLQVNRRTGQTPEIVVAFDFTVEPVPETGRPPSRKRDGSRAATRPGNGTTPVPETVRPPVPETGHKEEPMKKNPEEELAAAPAAAATGQQIGELFDVFKSTVNPLINFGHKTQRAAAESLIRSLGFENAIGAARYAVSIQSERFAPTITNPYQLVVRWGELTVYSKKSAARPKGIDLDAVVMPEQALAV